MSYSKQHEFPTHGGCANFRSGFCTLKRVAVNPDGAACPDFTPKCIMATPQAVKAYSRAGQPSQPYSPHITQGYPLYTPTSLPSPQTRHGYRTRYGTDGFSSALTKLGRDRAGFLSMSGGRRGGGGGRGSGGRGRGRMGGFAAGPGGSCVCPSCGYKMPHVIGTPCYQQTCPKCGSRMTRGG
jgi:hypothetical protein